MNRIVRNSLAILAAATSALWALPYHLRVPLTYQVTRGNGQERAKVVVLPIDSVFHKQDTVWDTSNGGATLTRRIRPDRTLWTIAIRDSLVSGTRAETSASWYYPFQSLRGDSLRLDTAVLTVQDSTKAWTQASCLAPLDLESWNTNKLLIPTPDSFSNGMSKEMSSLAWGGLAVVCHFMERRSPLFTTANSASRTLASPSGSVKQPGYSATYPMPRGHWSTDSGWVFQEDSATGESWTLDGIGSTPVSIKNQWITRPKPGDQWIWQKVDSFSWQDINLTNQSSSTISAIKVTLSERLADSASFQRWSATLTEGDSAPKTTLLAIDTSARKSSNPPEDSFLSTLAASFSLGYGDASYSRSFNEAMDTSFVSIDAMFCTEYDAATDHFALLQCRTTTGDTIIPAKPYNNGLLPSQLIPAGPGSWRRSLVVSSSVKHGLGLTSLTRLETAEPKSNFFTSPPPTTHSTRYTLVAHNGVNLENTGVKPRATLPRAVSLRGLADLESLLAQGGVLVRAVDSRGRILASNARTLPQALKAGHGMFFVQARSKDGALAEVRLAMP